MRALEINPLHVYQPFGSSNHLAKMHARDYPNYTKKWEVGTKIVLMLDVSAELSASSYSQMVIELFDGFSVITPGWVHNNSKTAYITWTPSEEGLYCDLNLSVDVVDTSGNVDRYAFLIEPLEVKASLPDHVKIKLDNDVDKFGVPFPIFKGAVHSFIEAKYTEVSLEGDFETMEDSDGQIAIINSELRKKHKIEAFMLSSWEAVHLSMLSGLNRLVFNNEPVVFNKPIEISQIGKTNLYNAEGDAYALDWEYRDPQSKKESPSSLFLEVNLLDDENNFIIDTDAESVNVSVNNEQKEKYSSSSVYPSGANIKIYTSDLIDNYFKIKSDTIYNLILHDTNRMIDFSLFAYDLKQLVRVNILADLSAVKILDFMFSGCYSLLSIEGLTATSYNTTDTAMAMLQDCRSLKEIYVNFNNGTDRRYCFSGCLALEEIKGRIGTSPAATYTMAANNNLKMPSFANIESHINSGGEWINPSSCSIYIETKDINLSVKLNTNGFSYSNENEFVNNGGTFASSKGLAKIGINFNSGVPSLYLDQLYDNIEKMVINDIAVVNLDNFVKGFAIDKIIFKKPLTAVTSMASAFEGSRIPNYINAPNCVNYYRAFFGAKGDKLAIITSNNVTSFKEAFASRMKYIYGVIDTSNAVCDKEQMFGNYASLLERPNLTERTDLTSPSGSIYNF